MSRSERTLIGGIIGGVLNLVSSIAASTHGGDAPKAETKGDGESVEFDAGPLKVSISDKGLSVKLDAKDVFYSCIEGLQEDGVHAVAVGVGVVLDEHAGAA